MEDQALVRLEPSDLFIVAQFGTNKEPGCNFPSCDDNKLDRYPDQVGRGGKRRQVRRPSKEEENKKNNKKEYGQADEEGDSQTAGTSVRMDEAGRGGGNSSRQDKTRRGYWVMARVDVAQRAVPMRFSPGGVDPCRIGKSVYNYGEGVYEIILAIRISQICATDKERRVGLDWR